LFARKAFPPLRLLLNERLVRAAAGGGNAKPFLKLYFLSLR